MNYKSISKTLFLLMIVASTACSLKSSNPVENRKIERSVPTFPKMTGPSLSQLNPQLETQVVEIQAQNGQKAPLTIQQFNKKYYFPSLAILSNKSFAAARSNKLESDTTQKLVDELKKQGAINIQQNNKVGFISFYFPYESELFSSISRQELAAETIITADFKTSISIDQIKKTEKKQAELMGALANRASGFSGHKQMRVAEFQEEVKKTLGAETVVDGSNTKIGVTDSGITLSHPVFQSKKDAGKNRIQSIYDFTNQGLMFVTAAQKITARKPTPEEAAENEFPPSVTLISGNVIAPSADGAPPNLDRVIKISDFPILTTTELQNKLLSDNAGGAKITAIFEEAFAASDEEVDLDGNESTNDAFPVIVFPSENLDTPEQSIIYVASKSNGNFLGSKPLSDWAVTRETTDFFSEKVGFHFATAGLSKLDPETGEPTEVLGTVIQMVGYDPGNHGTHVTGIAAGAKTNLNQGISSESDIYFARVCKGGCPGKAIIDGMVHLAFEQNVDVINMSLGGLSPLNDGYDVISLILNRISELKNVLFIVSAGNEGPAHQTIGSPGTASLALTVGASATTDMIRSQYQRSSGTPEDFILYFSSRGPTAAGGFKPEILAPGTALSSVHLNTNAGERGGYEVYWGTSMAAPAATGAYALLLDAARKYNARFPEQTLPTDASTLRRVLVESARSLPNTSWIDQGAGIIDLKAAWIKLLEYKTVPPTSVQLAGKNVNLKYDIYIEDKIKGQAYNGSRLASINNKEIPTPVYGRGLYLSSFDQDSLYVVGISRSLPMALFQSPELANLNTQLQTSADEFVLETRMYGSDQNWVRAGVAQEVDCTESAQEPLALVGAASQPKPRISEQNITFTMNYSRLSTLNICIDRKKTAQLTPGDHGALIYAYRIVDGQKEAAASFIIPVYMTVPQQTLVQQQGYQITDSVKSFEVKRHYVYVPENTTLVRVTVETPRASNSSQCAGIMLDARLALNVDDAYAADPEKAKAQNCTNRGAPNETKRVTLVSKNSPRAGMWDLHVFGLSLFKNSQYTLKVDYVTATSEIQSIKGGIEALQGSFNWSLKEASSPLYPQSDKSLYVIQGIQQAQNVEIAMFEPTVTQRSLVGAETSYPTWANSVQVNLRSAKNDRSLDIDLGVEECSKNKAGEISCSVIDASQGGSDQEVVTFKPKADHFYQFIILNATGSTMSIGAVLTETLIPTNDAMPMGKLEINGNLPNLTIGYSIDLAALEQSVLLKSELVQKGIFQKLVGKIAVRTQSDDLLINIPIHIQLSSAAAPTTTAAATTSTIGGKVANRE